MQYKTSKDFLLRFGLNDVNELPSMEEFSQLASDGTIEITPSEPQESPSLFEPESDLAPSTNEGDAEAQLADTLPETLPDTTSEATAFDSSPKDSSTPEPEIPQAQEPQSEADSGNTPEAAHSKGQQ
jgi:segregation and condensation protein B